MGKAVSKYSCIEMHVAPSSHFKSLTAKTWHACGCPMTPGIHPNTLTDHTKPQWNLHSLMFGKLSVWQSNGLFLHSPSLLITLPFPISNQSVSSHYSEWKRILFTSPFTFSGPVWVYASWVPWIIGLAISCQPTKYHGPQWFAGNVSLNDKAVFLVSCNWRKVVWNCPPFTFDLWAPERHYFIHVNDCSKLQKKKK